MHLVSTSSATIGVVNFTTRSVLGCNILYMNSNEIFPKILFRCIYSPIQTLYKRLRSVFTELTLSLQISIFLTTPISDHSVFKVLIVQVNLTGNLFVVITLTVFTFFVLFNFSAFRFYHGEVSISGKLDRDTVFISSDF